MFALGVLIVFVGVFLLTPGGGDAPFLGEGGAGAEPPPAAPASDLGAAADGSCVDGFSPAASLRETSPPGSIVGAGPPLAAVGAARAPPPPLSLDRLSTESAPGGMAAAAVSPARSAPWSDVPLGDGGGGSGGGKESALPAPAPKRAARRRTCNALMADVMADFSVDAERSLKPLLGLGPSGSAMAAVSLFSVPYEGLLPTGGGGHAVGTPGAACVLGGGSRGSTGGGRRSAPGGGSRLSFDPSNRSRSFKSERSEGVTKLVARPEAARRAVRPMRWM